MLETFTDSRNEVDTNVSEPMIYMYVPHKFEGQPSSKSCSPTDTIAMKQWIKQYQIFGHWSSSLCEQQSLQLLQEES